jgi:hypothetical protein
MNVEKESVKKKKKCLKKKTFFQPPLYHRCGIVEGGDQWNNFLYFYPQLKFKKLKKQRKEVIKHRTGSAYIDPYIFLYGKIGRGGRRHNGGGWAGVYTLIFF